MEKKNNYAPLKLLVLIICLFMVGAIPDDENVADATSKPINKKSTRQIKTPGEAWKAGVPVILKLGSDRCRPCIAMNPIIKELASEQDGKAVFLALDVYQNRELAGKFNVRVIPTVIFFDKHGKPKAKTEGFMNKEQILKTIDELRLNK